MKHLIIFITAMAIFLAITGSGCVPTPRIPVTPAATATLSSTWTPTATTTPSPTATSSPTPTRTPTITPSPTASPTLTPSSTPSPTVTPSPAAADWQHLLWRLINQERAKQGLYPLIYNDTLALAAQRHAQDCAQRGSGGHVGSDGATLRERLKRVGYAKKWVTESWAWARTPQRAVFMWLDETPPDDPHRSMLLSNTLHEVGVGVAPSNGGYYFIADFGR